MSAIAILVLFLALLAFAISATLTIVYYKLNRLPRSQDYTQDTTGLVSSLSMGSIEKHLGFCSPSKPARRIPVGEAPTICVSTTTSFHSLESMEAINDGSYYPCRTHVCSSKMYESIIHRRIGSRGIRPRQPIQYFVNTVQVAPVGDATPFNPLECDSDLSTFQFPTNGPSEDYLRAMGYKAKETEPCESILPSSSFMSCSVDSAEIASEIAEDEAEEIDIDSDPFHQHAQSYYESAMSLEMGSYDLSSIIKEIDDEIMAYQEADFINHPSSKAPSLSTLMEEDESLEEADIACCHSSSVSRPSTSLTLESDEPFFSRLDYLAPLSRASRAPDLLTVAEEDESSEDDGSLFDDSTCESSCCTTSTTSTTPWSPEPSLNTTCDTSNNTVPLNWPTIAVSNTTSFHTLDSLEALCDYARDHNVSTSHICTTDLWHGMLWRPIFESENTEDNEVDHTLLSLNWVPMDEYDYGAETDEEDEVDFAFLADNDHDDMYDDMHYYKASSYAHARSWHSENGMLDAIAEDDEDGDARISLSDAEMLDVIPEDDEDGDACLSSSDEDESLSSSAGSMPNSASSSCTSLELDVASDCEATSKLDYSFGVPLTRYPSRRGIHPLPLSLVARLG